MRHDLLDVSPECISLSWGSSNELAYPASLVVLTIVAGCWVLPAQMEQSGITVGLIGIVVFIANVGLFGLFFLETRWKANRVTDFIVVHRNLCVLERRSGLARGTRDSLEVPYRGHDLPPECVIESGLP